MSTVEQEETSGSVTADGSKNFVVFAWVCVALFPVFYLIAIMVSNILWAGFGFVNSPTPAPVGQRLIMVVISTVIFAIPAVGAITFGRKAHKQGHESGNIAAWAGGIIVAFLVLASIFTALVTK